MPRNSRSAANEVVDAEAQAAYEALLNAPLDADQAEALLEGPSTPAMQEFIDDMNAVIADLGPVVEEDGTPTEATVAILTGRVGAGACVRDDDGRLKEMAPSLPENPERVKLVGIRLGVAAPKYDNLQASVIKRDNHVWGGHSNWVMVIVDGMTQRRWFWAEDVKPVRAPRARRTEAVAA